MPPLAGNPSPHPKKKRFEAKQPVELIFPLENTKALEPPAGGGGFSLYQIMVAITLLVQEHALVQS